MEFVTNFFYCILFFIITRFIVIFIYQEIIAPILHLNIDFTKTGQWAVITGSTDGIGKQYAEQLASKGMDVVLISRTRSKLESTASDIRNKYRVNTKIIEADFIDNNSDLYDRIEKELRDLDIGVLVNNVGMMNEYPIFFLEIDKKDPLYDNIIKCNIVSVVNMCRTVLPGMVKRRRGVIINVSSASSLVSFTLFTVYGASKAFVTKFSKDLASEYNKDGITVQCVTPSFIKTKLLKFMKDPLMVASPETYVNYALKTTGIKSITIGYPPHWFLVKMCQLGESIFGPLLIKIQMYFYMRERKKYLKET
ncbi:very-long-chain 3-oxoacyl-CoA reductase-B-like isoform X2 [Adelges cooleyi]|uniref:very-long-chain 3-oxoacyl-CoA reductase-B-like isoform X1 n=1 Tax=Adelges cooleyi TaxID=133065 RepID=UPI00217F2730|nr:very-long-chain 3-oxoacyl-CoA reductase-B-like isoform X1 [Adelges cooleyi]XP_050444420.1 very-long-chain 3-oxoacyl-CoA reductase-B-like isoform X1 [Adelges cooleyi]XP_050444421.1 very-long-chain 3-oxoacyl-CoA reductase-B-like isoform X2 [Adelges cooleyi]